jgi:hypothetical protein
MFPSSGREFFFVNVRLECQKKKTKNILNSGVFHFSIKNILLL